ncbi:MAG TPA: cytochrome c [Terriglobales bacterium]|jgi:mono/diheme cytochrome c family protein|nr:cytochrome c [Terriglobales bacterium]
MRVIPSRLVVPVFLVCLTMLALPCGVRAQTTAAKSFKTNCTLCHGDDGSGNSPTGKALKAKDLASAEVQAISDADLATVIAKGKGKMPAFGSKLSPDVINSLVVYIRHLPKK